MGGGRGTEVCHEEGGEVLCVGAALYVRKCLLGHGGAQSAFNEGEGGNVAIVHDGVNPECEGVVVGWCDGCRCCGTNVGKENWGGDVGTNAAEVRVMERGLDGFVERGV